jgi:hypothetical protein
MSQGATPEAVPLRSFENPKIPIIFIPGYAASSPHRGTILQYTLNRGAAPQTLDLSPSYSLLVRSLTHAGYLKGKTFFGAVYDYRMAAAPTDGVNDGILQNVTAPGITSGNFSYAVNYLGYWLDQAVQANPGLEYVDVITHSTGGVVARSYVQSPAYGGEYVDGNGVKRRLPKVRYLILGANIFFGTVHSWRPWNGDFQDVLSGFIPTTEVEARLAAVAFAHVTLGGTIPGPDHEITREHILRRDRNGTLVPDPVAFFRLYVPMRQSLMPTTDFLTLPGAGNPANVNNNPEVRSDVLLDLNAGSSSGNNPWAQRVGIQRGSSKEGGVINTFATGARQKTSFLDFLVPGRVNHNPYVCSATGIVELGDGQGVYLPLTTLLESKPKTVSVSEAEFPRVGDTETTQPLAGDGNGFFDSYEGYTFGDPNIQRVQWGNGPFPTAPPAQGSCTAGPTLPFPPSLAWNHFTDYPVYHDVLFYNPDVRKFVVETLTGKPLADEPVITFPELNGLLYHLNPK